MRFSGTGIFTRRSMSIALSQASFFDILRCSCTASAICSPTVSTGLSEVIGSWKIIAMSLPRIFRISDSLFFSRLSPLKLISPPSKRPGGEGMRRMIESALTDLPLPDSPTIPSVEPFSIAYDSPLTARTIPSSVLKLTRRLLTSSKLTLRSDPGQGEQRAEKTATDRNIGSEARHLCVAAEASAIRALGATADRPREAFLFRRLDREHHDQQYGRRDEDTGKRVRQPWRIHRERAPRGVECMLELLLKLLLRQRVQRRRCGRTRRRNRRSRSR